MVFTRHGCRKRVNTISEEEIRKLLKYYAENGIMDPKTAKQLLDRILEIIIHQDNNERREIQ